MDDESTEAGLNAAIPVFLVDDIASTMRWYQANLGFSGRATPPAPPHTFAILSRDGVTIFLQQVVLLYLPQVIVAVLILVLAAIVAEAAKNIIAGSARAAGAHSGNLAGTVAKYAIWTTAVLAVLNQLGVATEFVQTLFTGIVVAIALGFGLAFGLGGKEAAARTIERVRSEVAHGR